MANWASLQEQLVGKPVFKRARHGIHFKQSDGSILANFTGRPCHYQDTDGLWKPIDTRPQLRKDGWFGAPHSDVIIHPDGTVKVGDYQQKASLISAKSGVIDGDRIARPFAGGVQYLYITEAGFRQEIVLEKCPDLKQVSKFMDTVSGVLPSKYKASALSVKDSATAELADAVSLADAKSLVTYLEKAKYPVVIDPDFSAQPDATAGMDTYIFNGAATTNYGTVYRLFSSRYFGENSNALIKFDISSIPDGSSVSAASLVMVLDFNAANANYTHNVYRMKRAWVEGEATWNIYSTGNNWSTAGGTGANDCESDAIGSYEIPSADGNGDSCTWELTASTKSDLDLGYGWMIRRVTTDFYNGTGWYSSDHTGNRPLLTVTYTAAASTKHFLSLLGVGK